MRLAFCFTGQPRDARNTLKRIKESWCGNQDVDFFFHSWYGKHGVPFRDDVPSDVYTDDLFDNIISELNPVSYHIDEPVQFKNQYEDSPHWRCFHPKYNKNPSFNIQSQFYSNMKCIELKSKYEEKNNIRYDAVFRCRFDYYFNHEYKISDYDLNYLHIKNDCKHTEYAINDHLALSNSDNMNIYGDLFNNLQKYYSMGVEFNPEVILGFHIYYSNIKVAKTLGGEDDSNVSTTPERLKMRFV